MKVFISLFPLPPPQYLLTEYKCLYSCGNIEMFGNHIPLRDSFKYDNQKNSKREFEYKFFIDLWFLRKVLRRTKFN